METNSIFIICQHRTGSTLLKNILDQNTQVAMAFDEMNLFEPCRNNTLDRVLENGDSPEEIINAIRNKEVYGTFWQDFEKSGIDINDLKQDLESKDKIDAFEVISSVTRLLSRNFQVRNAGAKYPVHYKKMKSLRQHFPEAKIIFLTRNPLAIIASKLNDKATKSRKSKSIFHRFLVHYFTLLYFTFEFNQSIKIYQKNKADCLLMTYENLVTCQMDEVKRLCEYCDLEFEQKMLQVDGKATSYETSPGTSKQLHTGSVNKYKSILSKLDQFLITMLTRKYYRRVQKETEQHQPSTNY